MQFRPLSLSRRSLTTALGAATLVTLLVPGVAHAQAGFTTDDTQLLSTGASLSPLAGSARSGFTGTPSSGIVPIFVYRLGALTPGTTITSAVLSLNFTDLTNQAGINYNVDLYGIGYRTTPTIAASDFYVGPLDTTGGETLLQDNFVLRSAVPTTAARVTSSILGSAAIGSFLNAQYAAGATAGNFVFFRLSPDTASAAAGGYNFSTQDNASTSGLRPLLTITTAATVVAPEPGAGVLVTVVLLPLIGVVMRRRILPQ